MGLVVSRILEVTCVANLSSYLVTLACDLAELSMCRGSTVCHNDE